MGAGSDRESPKTKVLGRITRWAHTSWTFTSSQKFVRSGPRAPASSVLTRFPVSMGRRSIRCARQLPSANDRLMALPSQYRPTAYAGGLRLSGLDDDRRGNVAGLLMSLSM